MMSTEKNTFSSSLEQSCAYLQRLMCSFWNTLKTRIFFPCCMYPCETMTHPKLFVSVKNFFHLLHFMFCHSKFIILWRSWVFFIPFCDSISGCLSNLNGISHSTDRKHLYWKKFFLIHEIMKKVETLKSISKFRVLIIYLLLSSLLQPAWRHYNLKNFDFVLFVIILSTICWTY